MGLLFSGSNFRSQLLGEAAALSPSQIRRGANSTSNSNMVDLLDASAYACPRCPTNPIVLQRQNEIHPRKLALGRLLNQPTNRAAPKLSISCSIIDGILIMNRSCGQHLLTPLIPQWEIVSFHVNVDSRTHKIIAGYWVGPDIDDGWGYIEAFINPVI